MQLISINRTIISICWPLFEMKLLVDFWRFPRICAIWSLNCFYFYFHISAEQFYDKVCIIIHLFWKIFVGFLTSTLLRAQNTTLLSKVRQRFFHILWPSQKTQTLPTDKNEGNQKSTNNAMSNDGSSIEIIDRSMEIKLSLWWGRGQNCIKNTHLYEKLQTKGRGVPKNIEDIL